MFDDKRLIEDYLPIEAISAEASREKSVRKGHISTLHLWWARRPLVACRAAVYGALVPASQFVPNAGSDQKKKSLGRANAAKFITGLCQYPGSPHYITEARHHILAAHAERLTLELAAWESGQTGKPGWVDEFKFGGKTVSADDIVAGRAPRPRVLDMFAGGGAIPLEALRLGCEAYANDLNPVAHIIQLCTLVYPQKYGKPDPTARGMTGPKDKAGHTTWGGLANEVRYWGDWVLRKVKAEIGDLYPLIPDPAFKGKRLEIDLDKGTGEWVAKRTAGTAKGVTPPQRTMEFATDPELALEDESAIGSRKSEIPPGYLMPVAYLWTRTVKCKNPNCKATVPLVKQTWLCQKAGRFVALRMIAPRGKKQVRFEAIEARTEGALGFDPAAFSKAGNATCPFCGTVADSDYVKAEGCLGRMKRQLMAVVAKGGGDGRTVYLSSSEAESLAPDDNVLKAKIEALCKRAHLHIPDTAVLDDGKSSCWCRLYGLVTFSALHLPRQLLCLLGLTAAIRELLSKRGSSSGDHPKAVATMLALAVDRVANYSTTLCVWRTTRTCVLPTFSRQALPLVWDFGEMNPFCGSAGDWIESVNHICSAVEECSRSEQSAEVIRGSATECPLPTDSFDAVVTDPPYYDNVFYANLADFFYGWLKQSVGDLHSEHFASSATPKRQEAVADSCRHNGSKELSVAYYEQMMADAFCEANRVLKPGGATCVVYAHKTTLGWATLVDALRRAGSQVTEAWPVDTEMAGGMRSGHAHLASSIFLVARKREGAETGHYEDQVKGELEQIVRERVETLWAMGISGADLVIACVGAGLRAFTRFARVEYANGEEVPAERFLFEVETVVLETILARLSKEVGGKGGQTSLAGMDAATRFYVLWRYTYGGADLDAGEAIIFANGTHVELDGADGLSQGADAILKKAKGKYRLLDFTERGDDDELGLPDDGGNAPPLVDTLHRLLWLLEKRPPLIPEFLSDSGANLEQLRLVAQALAGPALKGGELADVSPTAELSALAKLLANWSQVMEGKAATADRQKGQPRLL